MGSDNTPIDVRGEVSASKYIKNIDSAVTIDSMICNVHCNPTTTLRNSNM